MTTSAPHENTAQLLADLEDRTRRAWADYKEELDGLSGPAYATAEERGWTALQERLRELESDRARIVAS
jgi:hypothetical protein